MKLSLTKTLNEISRWKKQGHLELTPFEKVKNNIDRPWTFIHFSNNPTKLGINPTVYDFNPRGIYTYPLTQAIFQMWTRGQIEYASERKYIFILKVIKDYDKILASKQFNLFQDSYEGSASENFATNIINDLRQAAIKKAKTEKEMEEIKLGDDERRFTDKLIRFLSVVAGEDPRGLQKILQRENIPEDALDNPKTLEDALGFESLMRSYFSNTSKMTTLLLKRNIKGIVTSGGMHMDIPQGVFFDSSILKVVDVLPNQPKQIQTDFTGKEQPDKKEIKRYYSSIKHLNPEDVVSLFLNNPPKIAHIGGGGPLNLRKAFLMKFSKEQINSIYNQIKILPSDKRAKLAAFFMEEIFPWLHD